MLKVCYHIFLCLDYFICALFSLSTDELSEPISSEFGVSVLSAGIGHNEVRSKSSSPLAFVLMFNVKCTIRILLYKVW